MTTAPDSQPVPVSERLAEILSRYGHGHVVTMAITASAPELTAAVERTRGRLAGCKLLRSALPEAGHQH